MKVTAKIFNFLLVGIILGALLGSGGITYYAVKVFKQRATKITSTKLDILTANTQRDLALTQKSELLRNKNNIELLQKIVPKSKDQALAVAELQAIAKDNNISIGSLSFPTSELGSKKSSTTTTTTVTEKITQTKAVEGISGVLGIELTISQLNRTTGALGSGVTYSQLLDILKGIEKNRRTMQIKNIQIQPIIKSGVVVGYNPTITINLFVKQ